MKLTTIVALVLLSAVAAAAQDAPLTPKTLQAALDAKPSGPEADRLAARIRTYFGADALMRGGPAKVDDLLVAWALELPQPLPPETPAPRVVSDRVLFTMPLVRVGTSHVYAGVGQLAHGT